MLCGGTRKKGTYYVIVFLSASRIQNAFCNDIESLHVVFPAICLFAWIPCILFVCLHFGIYFCCVLIHSSYFSSVLVAQGL
jgi:hypothetical protein